MKCLFGHSFGKVENGYQYCKNCGKAQIPSVVPTPHPCLNGHIWVEKERIGYTGWYPDFNGGGTEWRDYKLSFSCKNCGQRKTEWLFGH